MFRIRPAIFGIIVVFALVACSSDDQTKYEARYIVNGTTDVSISLGDLDPESEMMGVGFPTSQDMLPWSASLSELQDMFGCCGSTNLQSGQVLELTVLAMWGKAECAIEVNGELVSANEAEFTIAECKYTLP